MGYMKLDDGSEIDKNFFEQRLKDLKQEKWNKKPVSELNIDHLNCELTFETISKTNSQYFFESDKGSIISLNSFLKYFKN